VIENGSLEKRLFFKRLKTKSLSPEPERAQLAWAEDVKDPVFLGLGPVPRGKSQVA